MLGEWRLRRGGPACLRCLFEHGHGATPWIDDECRAQYTKGAVGSGVVDRLRGVRVRIHHSSSSDNDRARRPSAQRPRGVRGSLRQQVGQADRDEPLGQPRVGSDPELVSQALRKRTEALGCLVSVALGEMGIDERLRR